MRAVIVSRTYADPAARGKLKALAGRGVALAVAVPARVDGIRQPVFGDDGGVRVVPIPVSGRPDAPAGQRWSRRTLARMIREFAPDIIQVEEEPGTRAAAAVRRIARRLQRPYVVFAQESLPVRRGLLDRLRRRRTLRGAAAVIAANRLALGLADAGTNRPTLIAPQVGLTLPPPPSRAAGTTLTIGFVGRLVPEKGLDLLLRAAPRVHASWRLIVVGSGPAQEELEGLAEQLGIASRVEWLGALARPALAELWPRLDCLACPSRSTPRWVEVVGRTPMEAMAHGIPVVATRAGALPDVVDEAGIIVDEEDVAGLAAAIERLCLDPAERERLAALARQRVVREYTDAALAEKTLQLWASATA